MLIGGAAIVLVLALLVVYEKHTVMVSMFREWLSRFINSYEFEFVLLSPSAKMPTRTYQTDKALATIARTIVEFEAGDGEGIFTVSLYKE
jgi:hypothetical protein